MAAAATARTTPRVLFVGLEAGSPQIAASVLRQVAGDAVVVGTSGTRPGDPGSRVDEMLVAMGLDPADERPLDAGSLRAADRVVVLGTGLDVARVPGPRYEQWDLESEDLLTRVEALADELVAVPVPTGIGVVRRLPTLLRGLHRR